MYKEASQSLSTVDSVCSATNDTIFESEKLANQFYELILEFSGDEFVKEFNYTTTSFQLQRYNQLITAKQFLEHIERREPVVFSLGGVAEVDKAFGWNTARWTTRGNLLRAVSEETEVMVESIPRENLSCTPSSADTKGSFRDVYGLGVNVARQMKNFHQLLRKDFQDEHYLYYLNLQPAPFAKYEMLKAPLQELQGDFPMNSTLRGDVEDEDIPGQALLQAFFKNVTEINLWMSVAHGRATKSRLHRDATDNLYLVLEGRKQFAIWDPRDVPRMRTIAPTFARNEDGLTYQLNLNKLRSFLQ